MELDLERQTKLKNEVEKSRRKLESSCKQIQSELGETIKVKLELNKTLKLKDSETNLLTARVEEDRCHVISLQKKITNLQNELGLVEEDLLHEKTSRIKAEAQKVDMSRQLDEIGLKLDEAGGVTKSQCEINKRREAELIMVRNDLETVSMKYNLSLAQMGKKHQDVLSELHSEQDQMKNSLKK